jgi:hypothetical protein
MTQRVNGLLTCHACGSAFTYCLIHDGFNESAHGYCERCGRTLLLELPWQDPKYNHAQPMGPITRATEATLSPCPCGGTFSASASPRCPWCHTQLSAVLLAPQIEANAPGTSVGWRWQNSWQGIHAFIVDDHQTTCTLRTGA